MTFSFSRRKVLLGLLLIGLGIFSLVVQAKADYVAKISRENVTVQISGDLLQAAPTSIVNATTAGFGTFPSFQGNLVGQNVTFLSQLLSDAIKIKASEAVVAETSFNVLSNMSSLHYDLNFSIAGVSSEKNGVERVNMAWRSFTIGDDFSVGSASINRLFPNYLSQNLVRLAQTSPNPLLQERIQLFVNNRLHSNNQASSQARNLLLFNFSSLALPLQSWQQTTGPSSTILLQATTGFNVTLSDSFTESGETGTAITNAVYNVNARIETPAYSIISNDQIAFETSGAAGNYELMIGIMLTTFILLVATFMVERRLQGRKRYPARKSKN